MSKQDIHIDPNDPSTTRIKCATHNGCCGGYHQTIAGALLNSPQWEAWYKHASHHQLFDVDESYMIDAMSDHHFAEFMKFSMGMDKILQDSLPDFIDDFFPKGSSSDRGVAIYTCALFINYLKNNGEKTKQSKDQRASLYAERSREEWIAWLKGRLQSMRSLLSFWKMFIKIPASQARR